MQPITERRQKLKKRAIFLLILMVLLSGAMMFLLPKETTPLETVTPAEHEIEVKENSITTQQNHGPDETSGGTTIEMEEIRKAGEAEEFEAKSKPDSEGTAQTEVQDSRPKESVPVVSQQPVPGAESGDSGHVHHWVEEVVAVHEAVTEVVHHDTVTEQRWVSVPNKIYHFQCTKCGAELGSQSAADEHLLYWLDQAIQANDPSLEHISYSIWSETQDNGYYETVIVQEAYDEVVEITPAWTEYIFRCTECGATG
ncbi:MAG: hypothetical protein IJ091_06570 [Oscillospiraceae bacterium]|nr:hypothetical protein [Oscillospiraceae bacterium]